MGARRVAAVLLLTVGVAVSTAHAETVRPSLREAARAARSDRSKRTGRHPAAPVLARSASKLARAKAAALRRARAAGAPPAAVRTLSFTAGLSGPGLAATDALLGVPPDTTGAIGPGNYVQEVNDAVAVFRRSDLARVAGPIPNELFMRPPFPAFVSDPQIQWDQQSGRWLYLAVGFTVDFARLAAGGPNYLVYGFSKTSDPTDLANGWCRYSLASGTLADGTPLIDDYPKLGHDDRHLIFGSNVFTTDAAQTFVTARIWSVPKPSPGPLTSCPAPPVATSFGSQSEPLRNADGSLAFTPVPANTVNASRAGYVVAAEDPTAAPRDQLMLWHVTGTATSPTLVQDGQVTVRSYRVPRPAVDFIFPRIDTLDGRLTMAVAARDSATGQEAVWTQHTIDPGNGSVVMRWYEVLPRSLRVRQIGTVGELGIDVYDGAVAPALGGTAAVLGFNRSGLFLLPEMDARVHRAGARPGATGPTIRLASSSAPDFDISCAPVCRWGDYSGASPDPLSPATVWLTNETIARPGGLLPSWSTQITAVDASAP